MSAGLKQVQPLPPISCIVGCYQLHLYCVNGCDDLYLPVEYTGATGGQCRAEARRDGWLIRVSQNYAVCPKCRKKSAQPQEQER